MADSPNQGDPKDLRRRKVRMAIGGLQTIYSPKRLTQLASRIDAERFAHFGSTSEEDLDELRRQLVDEIGRRGRLDDFLEHLLGNQPHPYFEPAEDEDNGPPPQRLPVNADFPVEVTESLSRPVVGGPLYECQQVVSLSGFVPKAMVQVYVDAVVAGDASELLGTVIPHYGFGEVKLVRALAAGDSVYATQTVDGVVGPESARLVVIRLPDFTEVPAPRLWSPAYACARLVNVDGLIPGARVQVLANGIPVGYADTAGDFRSVGLNRGVNLSAGDSTMRPHRLRAKQILCPDGPAARGSAESEPAVVVSPAPVPSWIPRIVQRTDIPGNDSVTVEHLTVGAVVRILDHGEDIGGGWATGETNWLGLSRRIASDSELVATMELCDGAVTRSEPSTPELRLPTPRILGPICQSDTEVEIAGTVLNATVALLIDGVAMAMVGAAPGETTTVRLGFALNHRMELRAIQFFELDSSESDESDPPEPIYQCGPPWITDVPEEILRDAPAALRPIACRPSTVPVFADRASAHDVIDVAISADFDTINSQSLPENQQSVGVVSYTDATVGQQVEISCVVQGRGVSRQGCGWRPLRLVFEDDVTGTIFDGSGRHIDTVTHCGYRPRQWEHFAGDDEAEHSRRVMQEFALYQALQSFGGMTLETRLAHFTYFDPSGNNRLERRYGFFRERKNNAAERCGMERQEDDEVNQRHPANATSVFQTAFHHRLLFHYDYEVPSDHNVVRMYDGNEDFYFPYDFDLSAMAAPDYRKNAEVAFNIRGHGNALLSWLRGQDEPLARVQVASVLQREAQLRQVVAGTFADDQGTLELEQWVDTVLRNLIAFLQT